MTGGSETNSDGGSTPPPGPADRTWTHPSEIGLATRGAYDRRRSSIIATGVVLGGLGLLLSGVLLGSGPRVVPASADSEPTNRLERSIATVLAVRGTSTSAATGLVIDESGHVAVATEAISGADEVRVRLSGSGGAGGGPADGHDDQLRAVRVASDERAGLTVLRAPLEGARPAIRAPGRSRAGTPVTVAGASRSRVVTRSGVLGSGVRLVGAEPSEGRLVVSASGGSGTGSPAVSTGDLVFDESGYLLGMASLPLHRSGDELEPTLWPADDLLALVAELIERSG